MSDKLKDMIRKVARKDLEGWKGEWEKIGGVNVVTKRLTNQQGESFDVSFYSNRLGTIAKVGGEEIGRGRIIYSQGGKRAVMEDGFVEEKYRRMGIGGTMLEIGKNEAEMNGAEEIVVEANKNSYGIASKMTGINVKRA